MTILIEETTPRARLRHMCSECGCHILPGTVYVRQRCADNHGEAWTYKAHEDCYVVALELDPQPDDNHWPLHDRSHDQLLALRTPEAIAVVRRMLASWIRQEADYLENKAAEHPALTRNVAIGLRGQADQVDALVTFIEQLDSDA